jgi:glycine cleavage system H protein
MDPFTYTDIFATKGIEYIVVIAFLALLIPFWVILNRQPAAVHPVRRAADVLAAGLLRVPQGIFFGRNHTWASLQRSGIARVGLDDFLLNVTGDISVNMLKKPGHSLRKGELMATVGQNGRTLRVYAPISGEVVETNSVPDITAEDPYGNGWICSIRPASWKEESRMLMMADEASAWLRREVDHFKDFLAGTLGSQTPGPAMVALQDGGELRANLLADMDNETWKAFQQEFLEG